MDLRLWLMAGTCAGYDDDAQISCEHGGEEGGQNVSLSALLFSVNSCGAYSKDELMVVVADLSAPNTTFIICEHSIFFFHSLPIFI